MAGTIYGNFEKKAGFDLRKLRKWQSGGLMASTRAAFYSPLGEGANCKSINRKS